MRETERYSRQRLFAGIGDEGQERLGRASAVLVGCGALGSLQAELLARAGLGRLRILDRDFVELSNLQRQVLFNEEDAARALPKAEAAAAALRRINSAVVIEPVVADLGPGNAEAQLGGVDLILDGTDNFETRYLLNDVAVKTGRPWIYGACVGAYGVTLTVRPGSTPCLRCLLPQAPPVASSPTCDTAGVIGPVATAVASIQSAEALKILTGHPHTRVGLLAIDLWQGTQQVLRAARDPECITCGQRRFEYLEGEAVSGSARLCGRNAVQVAPAARQPVDLAQLADRLAPVGKVIRNDYLIRLAVGEHLITVFRDGRAIVGGTEDLGVARSIYARYIGS